MTGSEGLIALVDCNSFYASCEKLFRPDLKQRPVIVLSNNDSCIVAASPEAKKAGLRRGLPLFQQRHIAEAAGAAVFSSNYTLYADISRRVMGVLERLTPSLEVYSIDEAFLEVPSGKLRGPSGIASYGMEVREKVTRYTGIPVSVGISSTKTLAKAANRLSKKAQSGNSGVAGHLYIIDESNRADSLKAVAVEDVWGVGRQYALLLRRHGIHTAYDLACADPWWVKKNMTLQGYRLMMELNGQKQVRDEDPEAEKKAILSSRQFGRPVTSLSELLEAAADYATAAAEKLIRQDSSARTVTVFLETASRLEGEGKYSASRSFTFPDHVSYTPEIIRASGILMREIYRSGYSYRKTGIILTDIIPYGKRQASLFGGENESKKKQELIKCVTLINERYGRKTVASLSSGLGGERWQMRREMLSPCYTTRIEDFPDVFAQ